MTTVTKAHDIVILLNDHLRWASRVSARVDLLKDGVNSPYSGDAFKMVLKYAHNPYIRFGIKLTPNQISDVAEAANPDPAMGWDIDVKEVQEFLDGLVNSTDSSGTKFSRLIAFAPNLNYYTANLVCRILDKSVCTGVSESTINKAIPNFIPVFNVQLASKFSAKKLRQSMPAYAEIKHDGMRAIGKIFPNYEVELVSRKGHPIPAATPLHASLKAIGKAYQMVTAGLHPWQGAVTDGELMGGTFAETMSAYRSDSAAQGYYHVFDILPMQVLTDDKFVSDTFKDRRETLRRTFELAEGMVGTPFTDVLRAQSYIVSSEAEVYTLYEKFRIAGHEGVIIKTADGLWETKRSSAWMKIKACETEDLRIIGGFEGEGEMVGTLGGIIVDRAGVQVRVGSGFKDHERAYIWEALKRDFAKAHTGVTDLEEFEIIGCLAEINFQEVTADGSLRHPVFIRLRKDKDEVSF